MFVATIYSRKKEKYKCACAGHVVMQAKHAKGVECSKGGRRARYATARMACSIRMRDIGRHSSRRSIC